MLHHACSFIIITKEVSWIEQYLDLSNEPFVNTYYIQPLTIHTFLKTFSSFYTNQQSTPQPLEKNYSRFVAQRTAFHFHFATKTLASFPRAWLAAFPGWSFITSPRMISARWKDVVSQSCPVRAHRSLFPGNEFLRWTILVSYTF